ncbi:exodeoxyribonuclease VII small subunit [Pontibacter sp. BT310]|jgi:exodeoxyribonuclease VII small subunit|uniref:Exodeoxyribonuclease VII small subunit n=1 Tax=Pontibacter populi TaxID=890055 RepID=A0ABS6X649_9BACT|nr:MULTISPECIES: exodeoxyribonuclease VII small subunit [Pontibacter]MBJ6116618.1 exodeoxyribonuclease VII small subunit [Pontibacter sp. BT310]MBR0569042.1 exodeoxyribonuclease VII small subunit [Microvirga sp. STS03]MBW3363472.1 exodeoxyribonuclease VII small subunit [Pontibacter populi]
MTPYKDISAMTYREATQELEEILRAIENDAVDVDELTQKVQRSSQLIKLCKDKLRAAEKAIDQVFNEENCEEPTKPKKTEGKASGTLF